MIDHYLVAGLAILIAMALGVCRALLGPTVFDRILAVNLFGTKAVLLVAIYAFFSERHDLLDIALLYSLLNFVAVIAALRLVERGKFFANSSTAGDTSTVNSETSNAHNPESKDTNTGSANSSETAKKNGESNA